MIKDLTRAKPLRRWKPQIPFSITFAVFGAFLGLWGGLSDPNDADMWQEQLRLGRAGMAVVGSATLHQGQLTRQLPAIVGRHMGMENDAGNAIQFSRSAPGIATSLIGMGRKEHVVANLKSALRPTATPEAWSKLFNESVTFCEFHTEGAEIHAPRN